MYWDGTRNVRAHRFSLALSTGADQPVLLAVHTCDNPPCVNPSHLRWATQRTNIRDMDAKGRRKKVPENRQKLVDNDG